jgi:hypothetical protein
VTLRVRGHGGEKRILFTCPGRAATLGVGDRRPVTLSVVIRPGGAKTCTLRLVGGSVDVVDGDDVALEGSAAVKRGG